MDVTGQQLSQNVVHVGTALTTMRPGAAVQDDWLGRVTKAVELFNKTIENVMRLKGGNVPQPEQRPNTVAIEQSRREAGAEMPAPVAPMVALREAARPFLSKLSAGMTAYEAGLTGGKPDDNVVDALRSFGITVQQAHKIIDDLLRG